MIDMKPELTDIFARNREAANRQRVVVEIATLTHDGDLVMTQVEIERVDGRLPTQCPGRDGRYRRPKWSQAEFEALPSRDQAIHLACPNPGLCFAEGDLCAGLRCGPCERWVDDPEQWLRDNAAQNEWHRARYGKE